MPLRAWISCGHRWSRSPACRSTECPSCSNDKWPSMHCTVISPGNRCHGISLPAGITSRISSRPSDFINVVDLATPTAVPSGRWRSGCDPARRGWREDHPGGLQPRRDGGRGVLVAAHARGGPSVGPAIGGRRPSLHLGASGRGGVTRGRGLTYLQAGDEGVSPRHRPVPLRRSAAPDQIRDGLKVFRCECRPRAAGCPAGWHPAMPAEAAGPGRPDSRRAARTARAPPCPRS
jgi:hypothetical protein